MFLRVRFSSRYIAVFCAITRFVGGCDFALNNLKTIILDYCMSFIGYLDLVIQQFRDSPILSI